MLIHVPEQVILQDHVAFITKGHRQDITPGEYQLTSGIIRCNVEILSARCTLFGNLTRREVVVLGHVDWEDALVSQRRLHGIFFTPLTDITVINLKKT